MSDESKVSCGCISVVLIALLVGIGLRSQSLGEFLAMAGISLLGILCGFGGLYGVLRGDCGTRVSGGFALLVTVNAIISVGGFLINGDYNASMANWVNATPIPAGQEAAQPTAVAEVPTATPTPQPSPTPAPRPAATAIPVDFNSQNYAWVKETNQPVDQITGELNRIWQLSTDQAAYEAAQLRSVIAFGSPEGQRAAAFMEGVAFERAGELGEAHAVYQEILKATEPTAYTRSASIREQLSANPGLTVQQIDDIYAKVFDQEGQDGWVLVSNKWVWDTSRHAAAQVLIDLRYDQISFQFFQYLRDLSPFPLSYAYLFIFLALTLGTKLVSIPLIIQSAKSDIKLHRLRPQVQMIEMKYRHDKEMMQKQLNELYQSNGVNVFAGCFTVIVDMVFVVWVMLTLNTFAPRLVLDGAAFWETPDVTRFSLVVAIGWALFTMLDNVISSTQQQIAGVNRSTVVLINLVLYAIFIGVAYIFKWPAYVFIFWSLLTITSVIIRLIRNGIIQIIERN